MNSLSTKEFHQRLSAYLDAHGSNPQIEEFEQEITRRAIIRFETEGDEAWDFHSEHSFFNGRGASILIQNLSMNWQSGWDWLLESCKNLPAGALVNFEVYDNIRGGIQYGGDMIVRRALTSDGIYEEMPE